MLIKILLILNLLFLSFTAHSEEFKFPILKYSNTECHLPKDEIDRVLSDYSHFTFNHEPVAWGNTIDLNGDGICEIHIYDESSSGSGFQIYHYLFKSGDKYISGCVTDLVQGAASSGQAPDGKYYHLTQEMSGHKTNPTYTLSAYEITKKGCKLIHKGTSTYGLYQNNAFKAYKDKNYKLAETLYTNAYVLKGQSNIKDANNIAITLIKQKKFLEAKTLINKHLSKNQEPPKSVLYNLGLIERGLGNTNLANQYFSKAQKD